MHKQGLDYYFIKRIIKGEIDLYERSGIPTDYRFLYYIHFPSIQDLFVICPNENKVKAHVIPGGSQSGNEVPGKTMYLSNNVDKKFKIFAIQKFGNCESLLKKLQAEFLTISDIPKIVELYNNCNE